MNKTELIREILSENDNLNSKQIMDILIQKYPQIWDNKVAFYAEVGKEKSESWVKRQLTAEVGRTLLTWVTEGKVIKFVNGNGILNTFIATDNFKKQFTNDISFKEENFNTCDYEVDEEIYDHDIDQIYEENIITQGIVYVLKSSWCEGIVKPGKSNVEYFEKRMYDLSRHNCYASYNLQLTSYVVTKDERVAFQIETGFHNYISEYRICPQNKVSTELKSKLRTELFYSKEYDLEKLFKLWITRNYINDPIKKGFIISTHFKD
jgi:hypothetical protein